MALALLVTLIIVLYSFLQHHYNYWQRRNVPHEKPRLLVGNLDGMGRRYHFRDINDRLYKRFKDLGAPFAGMFFFFQKAIIIIDLELVKQVLIKDFSNFHDRGIYCNPQDDPLSGHLLRLEGQEWREMRQKLTPVFTSGKMRYMFPTVMEVSKNLVNAVNTELQSQIVELKDLCARFTIDVIGTCAFGLECNCLQDPQAEFRIKGREIFSQFRHSSLVMMLMNIYPKLATRLHMKIHPDGVNDFFLNAVRQTVEYRITNNVKRNDFMDLLIDMKAKNEAMARAGNGIDLSQGLTFEQLAAQAFVFFGAGFHTSSTTMSVCLYELSFHAEIQQRLRREIVQVLDKHNNQLSYECVNEMSYLEQVIAETMRKYSIVSDIIRKTTADYLIPQTQQVIESGTIVIVPTHSIHHDPELYPEPNKFDPERFTPEAIQERHSCAYLPFGTGPRNCIGLRFGKMVSKIGIIQLLQNFKFSKSAKTQVPLKFSKKNFLLEPLQGIHLQVERI